MWPELFLSCCCCLPYVPPHVRRFLSPLLFGVLRGQALVLVLQELLCPLALRWGSWSRALPFSILCVLRMVTAEHGFLGLVCKGKNTTWEQLCQAGSWLLHEQSAGFEPNGNRQALLSLICRHVTLKVKTGVLIDSQREFKSSTLKGLSPVKAKTNTPQHSPEMSWQENKIKLFRSVWSTCYPKSLLSYGGLRSSD